MKTVENITKYLGASIVLITLMNCASSQKIDQEAPVSLKEPYFQKWVAGEEEGGSGFNIYLPLNNDTDMLLKTAYFKGKKVSLEYQEDENRYYGHYTYPKVKKGDVIMSNDPRKEYGNPVPVIENKIPFDLQGNDCIIEYIKNGTKGYFKIPNLPSKEILAYPSQPEK